VYTTNIKFYASLLSGPNESRVLDLARSFSNIFNIAWWSSQYNLLYLDPDETVLWHINVPYDFAGAMTHLSDTTSFTTNPMLGDGYMPAATNSPACNEDATMGFIGAIPCP